jgi:hypothetical protein
MIGVTPKPSAQVKKTIDLFRSGVIFACASCTHMQVANDKGSSTCGQVYCGTPISTPASAFVQYAGPLEREYFGKLCWVCGQEAQHSSWISGFGVHLGLCAAHQHFESHYEKLSAIVAAAP